MQRLRKKHADGPVAGKEFPKEPMEKVPDEKIKEMLEAGKAREVAAMGKRAVPALLKILHGGDSAKKEASLALVMMGKPGAQALVKSFIPGDTLEFARRSGDEADEIREKVSGLLALGGSAAIPSLVKMVCKGYGDRYFFLEACVDQALGGMGKAVVPELLREMGQRKAGEIGDLLVILAEIGDASAVPALVKILKGAVGTEFADFEKEDLLFNAIVALEKIAEKNLDYDWRDVAPLLVNELREGRGMAFDEKQYVRGVAHALGRMGDPCAVPKLLDLLEENRNVREPGSDLDLVRLFESISGKKWKHTKTGDEERQTREAVSWAVWKIAKKSPKYEWKPFIPRLVNAVDDDSKEVRFYLVDALRMIEKSIKGEDFICAVPALVKTLKDSDAKVFEPAIKILYRIAIKHPEEVASELVAAVNGKLGDRLLIVSTENGKLTEMLTNAMRICELAMSKDMSEKDKRTVIAAIVFAERGEKMPF